MEEPPSFATSESAGKRKSSLSLARDAPRIYDVDKVYRDLALGTLATKRTVKQLNVPHITKQLGNIRRNLGLGLLE